MSKDSSNMSSASPSAGRLTLPKLPSRLPVRMVLSDPRVHNYLPKSAVSSRGESTFPSTTTPPSTCRRRQDQAPSKSSEQQSAKPSRAAAVPPGTGMYRSSETSQLRPHPYSAQQSSTAPRSRVNGAFTDLAAHRTGDFWQRRGDPQRHAHAHAHANGIDRYHSEPQHSPSSRAHSGSPRHLPSPSPSGPSCSPESLFMPPETWVSHGKGHWNCDSTHSNMMYQSQCEEQQERLRQLDLSSPSSDADHYHQDSRTLPLFPPYSPRPQGQTSQAPPATAPSRLSSLGPVKMTTSLSTSSNASNSSASTMNSFSPLTDNRTMTTPCVVPSKLHHRKVPYRSPERFGQELMMTSTTDTNSSQYLNMNFYDIYRQSPLLLRPEGGRHDDRRPHATHPSDDSAIHHHPPHHHHVKSKGKGKAHHPGSPTIKSEGGIVKHPRRHSVSLQSTATHRVLRNEVPHHPYGESSQDIVNSLGITESSTRASSRMSISHLLASDDEDDEEDDSLLMPMMSNGSGGVIGEPSNRTRMSKKRAGELGLLDVHGNIRGRKKSKKIHDPEQLSPAGFRHGGERIVQEPDEPIILDPTVGPIDVLDRITPPTVYWKGHPMPVVGRPGYELLHPHEAYIASTLRLSPAQYLGCKRTLILASREYFARKDGKQFRKSDAQKLCRIDVNKTSRLWEVFARIGWLEGIGEKDI